MPFSVNDPFLFWLSGIVIAAVLAESVFFLVKATGVPGAESAQGDCAQDDSVQPDCFRWLRPCPS